MYTPTLAFVELLQPARGQIRPPRYLTDMICGRVTPKSTHGLTYSKRQRSNPDVLTWAWVRQATVLPHELGLRTGGLEFNVWGLGFGVWDLKSGVWGAGFGVWGLGCGVRV